VCDSAQICNTIGPASGWMKGKSRSNSSPPFVQCGVHVLEDAPSNSFVSNYPPVFHWSLSIVQSCGGLHREADIARKMQSCGDELTALPREFPYHLCDDFQIVAVRQPSFSNTNGQSLPE